MDEMQETYLRNRVRVLESECARLAARVIELEKRVERSAKDLDLYERDMTRETRE